MSKVPTRVPSFSAASDRSGSSSEVRICCHLNFPASTELPIHWLRESNSAQKARKMYRISLLSWTVLPMFFVRPSPQPSGILRTAVSSMDNRLGTFLVFLKAYLAAALIFVPPCLPIRTYLLFIHCTATSNLCFPLLLLASTKLNRGA